MDLSGCLPFWEKLTAAQQEVLTKEAVLRTVPRGTVLHRGGDDCLGLLVVRSGQLRAYILSAEGREITLYRLFERDMCLLSASCMLRGIQFDITIEAEKDTAFWVIPAGLYRQLMEESAAVANYTNDVMSGRFSEVMWLMEQVLWQSFDKRLAGFLLEESRLEDSAVLSLTHERIAAHLGTAREVVTRMLRYFQQEGLVKLSRGTVEITAPQQLEAFLEKWYRKAAAADAAAAFSHRLLQQAQDLLLGPGPHGPIDDLAALHHHQCGDAHDLKGGGKLPLRIHIYFADFYIGPLSCNLIYHRAYHPAGAAPAGPKVQQHRLFTVHHFIVEILFGNIQS